MIQHPYARSLFSRFARSTSHWAGQAPVFVAAFLIILVWAVSGPAFGFSNTWQLVINTVTTTVTFLMVFLIQNTQNRDATAVQLKLDEILRGIDSCHNAMLDIEELSDADLERIRARYEELARDARTRLDDFLPRTIIQPSQA